MSEQLTKAIDDLAAAQHANLARLGDAIRVLRKEKAELVAALKKISSWSEEGFASAVAENALDDLDPNWRSAP